MAWAAARASLDFMLGRASRPITVEFSGGEPLLALDLLLRCMDYADSRRTDRQMISYGLITNGTLLTSEVIDLLASRDVMLRLSFDGPPGAQQHRGDQTFHRLDDMIDEVRRRHSDWFMKRFRVNAVLHLQTLGRWADAARYFLAKSVPHILFYPAVGRSGDCSAGHVALFEEQAQQIVDLSVSHWEATGSVPILFLREGAPSEPPGDGAICGAGEGAGICVDTDGMAWTCPFFTGSSSAKSALRDEASRTMGLGGVRDRALAERVGALPEKAAALRLMTRRREKFSSFGPCRDCTYLSECFLCPAAVSHQPGNTDPDRIPDFFCAYTKATCRARRAFQERTGEGVLKKRRERIHDALRDLRVALERGLEESKAKNGSSLPLKL